MKKTRFYCDKCGAEISDERFVTTISSLVSVPSPKSVDEYESKIDLCEGCYEIFKNDFINLENHIINEKYE